MRFIVFLLVLLALSVETFAQSALDDIADSTAETMKACVEEISALPPIDQPSDIRAFVLQMSDPFKLTADEVRKIEAMGPKTRYYLMWQVALNTRITQPSDIVSGHWRNAVSIAKRLDQETNAAGIIELMKYVSPKLGQAGLLCKAMENGNDLTDRQIEFAKDFILLRDAVNNYLKVYKTPEYQATIQARKERAAKEEADKQEKDRLAKIAEAAREWKDKTGKFELTAAYIHYQGGTVTLQKLDGTEIEVKLNILSNADQEFVRREIKRAKDAETKAKK